MAAPSVVITPNVTGAVSQELVGAGTGIYLAAGEAGGLDLALPPIDEEYAESADTEGGLLVRSRPQNPTGKGRVYIRATTAAAFKTYLADWQETAEAIRRYKGTLTYTPSQGTAVTYDLESFRLLTMPQDGFWQQRNHAESEFEFTSKPYGRLTPYAATLTDFDPFSSDTLAGGAGRWSFDAGSGTIAVSGGQLVPSSTAEKRLYRRIKISDGADTVKVITGASVASGHAGVTLKRLDASNEIRGRVNFIGATSTLLIEKYDGAAATTLATSGTFTTAAATSYWVKLDATGNVLTLTLYTSDPTGGAAAAQTLSYTLLTTNATKFGSGIWGNPGIRTAPQATDYRYDDFRVESTQIESSEPLLDLTVTGVTGSVDALGKLRGIEVATQSYDIFEYGADDVATFIASAPTPLLLDSSLLATSGFAGAQTTRSGSYDPVGSGNTIIQATLLTSPVVVCGTGAQSHIGRFRPKARLYGSGTGTIRARLAWRVGSESQWSYNAWVTLPGLANFYELSLGLINIPVAPTGTQTWEGRIEAYSTVIGDTIGVDYIKLFPAKRYGKARAPQPTGVALAVSAYDTFSQTVTGGSDPLSGVAAAVGGNWSSAGDATDFVIEDTGHTAQRSEVSDANYYTGRYGLLGTTTATDVSVQTDLYWASGIVASGLLLQGALARYTDASNNLFAVLRQSTVIFDIGWQVAIYKVKAGTPAVVAIVPVGTPSAGSWYTLRLDVTAAGVASLYFGARGSTPALQCSGQDADLATGGTLATGKRGIYDANTSTTAAVRNYDNVVIADTLPSAGHVLNSGKTMEIRHDQAIYEPASGSAWNRVPSYEGSYLKLTPAGRESLVNRLAISHGRFDTDLLPATSIADAVRADLTVTPRVALLGR